MSTYERLAEFDDHAATASTYLEWWQVGRDLIEASAALRAVLAILGPNGLVWDGEPVVRCADVYAAIAQVGHYPDDPRCIHWTLDQPVSHDIYCPICRAS